MMSDVKDYCEKTHKRLVGLKAGLFDIHNKGGDGFRFGSLGSSE
jgi:hypothetical protein